MIVVADSSPLHYLILIGQAALLPQMYGDVTMPTDDARRSVGIPE